MAIALAWLTGFLLFFSSFRMPNNPGITRWDIWQYLPFHLLEIVDPLPVEGETPPPSGWEYFPQRLDLVLVAALILAGGWGLGHLLLRLLRAPLPDYSLERTVFALALGLSGLSLITLGCGLAGWLSPWLLGGVLVGGVLGEWAARWAMRSLSGKSLPAQPQSNDQETIDSAPPLELAVACALVVAPFLLAMFLGAMLPSTDFDVKEYHLLGPKEWYLTGRITFLPHNVYTSFPFLTEMLSLLAMVLRGDWFRGALAGQLVLMTFGPLTGLALYAAGRRWFGPAAGLLAATVHLTTPWIYRISTIAYAEGGLTFYLFASLFAAMLAIESLRTGASSRRLVLLAGLLAGSAMACKYTGVLSVVIPLGAAVCGAALFPVPSHPARSPKRKAEDEHKTTIDAAVVPRWNVVAQVAAVYSLAVLLTVGPWLVKNAVQTGNPVYPLLYSVFGGRDWNPQLNVQWQQAHSTSNYSASAFVANFIDVIANNDWHSPLLYGLAPLAFLVVRNRRLIVALWVFVAVLFLQWWIFTHRLDRFWVPMIPVVSLLAGVGASWSGSRLWRYAGGTLLALTVLFNLVVVASGLSGDNAYLLDLDDARERAARITSPEILLVNQHIERGLLPPETKLLSVGDAELFDARFPVVYNTVFDRSIFQEWTGKELPATPAGQWPLRDAAEIRNTLQQHGITHVYVNWSEILRYRMTYGYTDYVTPRRFRELQQRGVLDRPIAGGLSYGDWERLSPGEREEIERWAPELIITIGGKRAWMTAEILPVQ